MFGLRITYTIEPRLLDFKVCSRTLSLLLQVFHRAQYSVPCCLFYTLIIYRMLFANAAYYCMQTIPFYSTLSQPVIQETLNEELELIGTWLRDNSLFLNTSKTESMLFGTHAKLSRATDFSIMINGRPIAS